MIQPKISVVTYVTMPLTTLRKRFSLSLIKCTLTSSTSSLMIAYNWC